MGWISQIQNNNKKCDIIYNVCVIGSTHQHLMNFLLCACEIQIESLIVWNKHNVQWIFHPW